MNVLSFVEDLLPMWPKDDAPLLAFESPRSLHRRSPVKQPISPPAQVITPIQGKGGQKQWRLYCIPVAAITPSGLCRDANRDVTRWQTTGAQTTGSCWWQWVIGRTEHGGAKDTCIIGGRAPSTATLQMQSSCCLSSRHVQLVPDNVTWIIIMSNKINAGMHQILHARINLTLYRPIHVVEGLPLYEQWIGWTLYEHTWDVWIRKPS